MKRFVKEKNISFMVNKNILSKYLETLNKMNRLVGKDLHTEVMILIFINGNDFHNEGLLLEQTSAYRCYKSYYFQALSEECNYLTKDNETIKRKRKTYNCKLMSFWRSKWKQIWMWTWKSKWKWKRK